ncbi:hypothetical protein [Herbaspirillum frisingense]|uniref:Ribosomal protein L18E n=1 Tax=Herbaspirillum frisingense TaxID=92645 RepID=A0ABU1PIF5_9BURK|nr:hypothetical protein [Herbaspirillum frisingense]MDR6585555.1 ribosomal protein L18E [Herbaspirillum frisingense]
MKKKLTPTPVVITDDLKAYLKHKAIDNARTLGKEIASRLEESKAREQALLDEKR